MRNAFSSRENQCPTGLRISEAAAKWRERRAVGPPRNWLERWLFPDSPDQRAAPRKPAPGLVAYFWSDGTPKAHAVRDISAAGLFVVTDERWHPAASICLTLAKTDVRYASDRCFLAIEAAPVRFALDGVGLEFVFDDPRRTRRRGGSPLDGVNSQHLKEFLRQISSGTP